MDQLTEVPQIQIVANRERLAYYGITVGEFTKFIELAFSGEKVSEIYEGQRSFNLTVKLNKTYTNDFDGIRNALIDTPTGKKIPLEQVATIKSAMGPSSISRENVQRKLVISANVTGGDLGNVVKQIKERISEKVTLPEGYRVEYGGQFESAQAASRTLMLSSIIALLVIFLLLYHEFKDSKLAGIVLINLPLALIGGVFAIWITSGVVSIPAIIGFITLFGIATRNGILLISHYKQLESRGTNLTNIIVQGSVDRLNPILMTALTAGLALIPLALNGNVSGNEIQSPMAKVILGGLLTSTLLNLYIVPMVYQLFKTKKENNVK